MSVDIDSKSYLTASGGSVPIPVQRELASSPTISIETASFHTPEPLESDYQRDIPVDIPDYGDDLSTRISKQAHYQQEDHAQVRDGITEHNDHFVTDPDQPKLALADSVQPTREKRPLSNSQLYTGDQVAAPPPNRGVRQRHHVGETTPLLSNEQQKTTADSDSRGCCNIL